MVAPIFSETPRLPVQLHRQSHVIGISLQKSKLRASENAGPKKGLHPTLVAFLLKACRCGVMGDRNKRECKLQGYDSNLGWGVQYTSYTYYL